MRVYHLDRAPAERRIDYRAELNPQQLEAVTGPPGPALVLAGAGSGKTRTLIYRVAWLVENGIDPANILLLTFTNKAAREMLSRVGELLPNDMSSLWGGTFHSVGNRILRRNAAKLGYPASFTILDRDDQKDLVAAAMTDAGVDRKDKMFPKPEVLADLFSFSVNTGTPLEELVERRAAHNPEIVPAVLEIRRAYACRKLDNGAMDFDDLLTKTRDLLRDHSEIALLYRGIFQFILVDEYQDTNAIQADLVDFLAGEAANITAVGDDAQSIYSWRGADHRNILEFPKRHPRARIYKIESNYRSLPPILEVANAAIQGNTGQFSKTLRAVREASATRPGWIQLATAGQQAQFVAQRIAELHEGGVDYSEIAVLYRAHFHALETQLELTRRGVPFAITSGLQFFEQAHIKDVAAFLRFAVNPSDEVAFKRMVKLLPGIGARGADALWAGARRMLEEAPIDAALGDALSGLKVAVRAREGWAQLCYTLNELAPGTAEDRPPPSAMIVSVLEGLYGDLMPGQYTDFENRRDDLDQLAAFSAQFDDVTDFLSQVSLLTGLDSDARRRDDAGAESVALSTVHQAKGLEWRVVFVLWLTEGMFPGRRAIEDDNAGVLEEERRLFYVAVTRAKDELYLMQPMLRTGGGPGDMLQHRSRFLDEIPEELLEKWEVSSFGANPF